MLVELEEISIEVERKRVKNLNIRIHPPDGTISVSVPWHASKRWIITTLRERLAWIRHHREKIKAHKPPPEPQFISGEHHLFMGQEYPLEVTYQRGKPTQLAEDTIFLNAPPNASLTTRRQSLYRWYKEELNNMLPPLIAKWEATMGVQAKSVELRLMKSRWGTCYPTTKKIWLNTLLMKYPLATAESVLVHELVHLLERKHTRRFYALMTHFLPDWQTREAHLKLS